MLTPSDECPVRQSPEPVTLDPANIHMQQVRPAAWGARGSLGAPAASAIGPQRPSGLTVPLDGAPIHEARR